LAAAGPGELRHGPVAAVVVQREGHDHAPAAFLVIARHPDVAGGRTGDGAQAVVETGAARIGDPGYVPGGSVEVHHQGPGHAIVGQRARDPQVVRGHRVDTGELVVGHGREVPRGPG